MVIKMKRGIRVLFGCFIVTGAVLLVNAVLSYVVIDDADDEVRYAMHAFYEQENIETLFLGSSHVFCGYDPKILDEIMGENTYLAATPVQKVDGSYYLLKEAVKNNPIQKVYLDVFYRQYRDIPAERTGEQMMYIYCITDYMKKNFNRAEFLLNASGSEHYVESFLASARYGNYLLDRNRLERIVKSKRSSEYINYENVPSNFYKGAMISEGTPGTPKMIVEADNPGISENVLSAYSLKYLDKIVALCKEEGIQLVLVATPVADFYIQALGNYDTFYHYMRNYAETNEIEYYDFNLCRKDILDMEDNDFMDYHHLSGKGAAKYSAVFAEMMVSYDEEKRQELFYQSVQEKMEDMSPQTMGIALYQSEEEENIYSLTTIANYDVDVEYRICITDEQGNEVELVQDFSGNNIVESFPGEPVTFKITVRLKDTGEICEEEFIYL